MRYAEQLKNNAHVKKALSAAAAGVYSHAYVVIAEDEYTTEVVGAALAAKIAHADEERIFNNKYADVYVFPEERDKVLSEDVDRLTSTAYVKPTELDKKIYIIKKASTMNESSQNKLLKTLEEPPPSVVIILEAQQEFSLLPTVLSRCTRIDVPPLDGETLQTALDKYYPEENTELAALLSGGYTGRAEKILADENYEIDFELALETLLYMKSSKTILSYSRKWMERKDTLADVIDCLGIILSDCMSVGAGLRQRVRLKSRLQDVCRLAEEYTIESVVKIMECLSEAKRDLSLYCNAQAVVDGLLFKILEVKAKCRKS